MVPCFFGRIVRRQFHIADHYRKDVVEIVGNASGESTDRLHFLGMTQPFLQLLPSGSVVADAKNSTKSAVFVVDGFVGPGYRDSFPTLILCSHSCWWQIPPGSWKWFLSAPADPDWGPRLPVEPGRSAGISSLET